MIIYRQDIELINVEIDDKSVFRHTILGDEICELNFTIDNFIDFQIGDYVLHNDQIFKINTPKKNIKTANNEYQYSLRFEGIKYELGKILFKLDGETEFFLSSDIEQILDHVIINLNEAYDITWAKGVCSITSYFDFQIQNENCLQVLNKSCIEFGVEFEVIPVGAGYTINVRDSIGIDEGIELSYKSGIFQITSEPVGQDNVVTKVYPFGASKNIPSGYGSSRIKITPLENNIDLYGLVEQVLIYEDIYPNYQGTVTVPGSGVVFRDSNIPFNLNNQLIPGVTAKVVFLSGDLSGYEFEVSSYNNSTKQVTLVQLTDDIGQSLPSGSLVISQFDRYTFVDIYLPQSYIDAAETELETRAQEFLDKYSIPLEKYSIVIDARSLRGSEIQLYAGERIKLVDSDMSIDSLLRIYSITQSLANPYKYDVELTDNLMITRMIKLIYGQFDIEKRLEQHRKELRILKHN